MAAFEAWLVFLILVVNVVGELQRKRTLAASRGFLAAARLSINLKMLDTESGLRLASARIPQTPTTSPLRRAQFVGLFE